MLLWITPNSPTTNITLMGLNLSFSLSLAASYCWIGLLDSWWLLTLRVHPSGAVPELLLNWVLPVPINILGLLGIWGMMSRNAANGNVVVWVFWLRELPLLLKMRSQVLHPWFNLLGLLYLTGFPRMTQRAFTRILTCFPVSFMIYLPPLTINKNMIFFFNVQLALREFLCCADHCAAAIEL